MKNFVFGFFIITNIVFAQSAGETGYSFLKIGTGAKEMSIGTSTTSRLNSTFSLNYNPALITDFNFTSFGFSHNEWIEDLRNESIIANSFLFNIPFFISINSTNISNIEIRTVPGEPEGVFDAHYFSFGFGSGFRITSRISVGVQAKYLYENIYVDESNGFAFDVGLSYKKFLDFLDAGLSLRNLGKTDKLKEQETKLPTEFRFGFNYANLIQSNEFQFYPSFEIQKFIRTDEVNFLFGLSIEFKKLLSFSGGYKIGTGLNNFSFGIGINYRMFQIDYALLPFTKSFGNANIISISVTL